MNILAFDTSTDACSVALRSGDEILIDHRIARQQHALLLMPMIDTLMADAGLTPAQLNGVVFGRGPGSFTGVRMAVAAAQGLGLALDIGVLGVSTLQCLAQGAWRQQSARRVVALLDARMDQVYQARFELDGKGLMQPQEPEAVMAPGPVTSPVDSLEAGSVMEPVVGAAPASASGGLSAGYVAVGSGAERYAAELACPVLAGFWPEARYLLELAGPNPDWVDAAEAQPVYLRNQVAQTEAERGVG